MAKVLQVFAEPGRTYSNVVLNFVNKRGKAAKIDTTGVPVTASVNTPGLLTIDNIVPIDPVDGLAERFKCRVKCANQNGIATAKFRADRDITPQGEDALEIDVEITIREALAEEAFIDLGEPDAEEPPPVEGEQGTETGTGEGTEQP